MVRHININTLYKSGDRFTFKTVATTLGDRTTRSY